jgi:hypothetical protein
MHFCFETFSQLLKFIRKEKTKGQSKTLKSRQKTNKNSIMKKLLLIGLSFFATTLQSQNKIESSLQESYSNGIWEIFGGTNYQYDANNNLTTETYYSTNSSNTYIPSDKSLFVYNANNKVVTQTIQNWNTNNQFENSYKATYTYDGTGKLITIVDQDWLGGSWVNNYKTDITYNGNLITSFISQQWVGSQYVNDSKGTISYTGTILNQILNEEWNGSQWITSYRSVLTYNGNNKIINDRLDTWTGTAWNEDQNTAYIIAANGNRTSEIFSFQGAIYDKKDYLYDAAAQISNFAHPFKDKTGVDYLARDFPYVNKILNSTRYSYNSNTSSYDLSFRTTYNYLNQLPLRTENFEIKDVFLYPNPVDDSFALSGLTKPEKVRIYSVMGQLVFEGTTTTNEKINVQNLPVGLYFLNFEDGKVLKFIKN